MSVVIINPNSTVEMTDAMLKVAQDTVPELAFEGWTSHKGPPSIQGAEDGALAEPHLLELVRKADEQNASGVLIGCFDDTALKEAAKHASCPVIGIGQAAYHYAALRNWRFSVVTTLAVSIPILEQNIRDYGLGPFLGKVRASNVPVLALHDEASHANLTIAEEASNAEAEDKVDAVILGCAGMVNVTETVRKSVAIAVIDPVVVASTCIRWLCA